MGLATNLDLKNPGGTQCHGEGRDRLPDIITKYMVDDAPDYITFVYTCKSICMYKKWHGV